MATPTEKSAPAAAPAPLCDLRVLDFTSLWPGPLATMILADLGAQVIAIDAPDRPDLLRWLEPMDAGGEGAAWRMVGRGKRRLALDLRRPQAREVIERLVATHDVVVEQFRPGVLDRLGIGWARLSAIQPRLIWCAITGFGQDGPWRDRPGHDIGYLAVSGIASHMGRAGEGPAPWTALPGDVAGGTWPAVAGILAAAFERTRTGKGRFIDIAMADGALFLNALAVVQALHGGGSQRAGEGALGGGSIYDHYRTADGRVLAVGALEPKFCALFLDAIGRPDLNDQPLDSPAAVLAVKAEVAAAIAARDGAHWRALFDRVPCGVELVLTTEEALALPHYAARGMVVDADIGGAKAAQLRSPVRLVGAETGPFAARPAADADAILAEIGYGAAETAELRATGALGE